VPAIGGKMKRTGTFITKEELEGVRIEQKTSGMFLSGGQPMGNPQRRVKQLVRKYDMPEGTGLDLSNGEFVSNE